MKRTILALRTRNRRRGFVLLATLGLNAMPSTVLWASELLGHAGSCEHAHAEAHPQKQQHTTAAGDNHPDHARGHLHHASADTARPATTHPAPRQGITAAKVVTPERLLRNGYGQREADGYAAAARIPEVIDGIYCHCHCTARSGHYSLLTCFESGHSANCNTCLGSGLLAARLHAEGKSLEEIRAAVDAQFGQRKDLGH